MNNRENINRLKEEYKTHYRAMRETAKKARSVRRRSDIASALGSMNSDDLFDSLNTALDSFREKLARTEARFEVLMEEYTETDSGSADRETEEFEQEQRREQARKTVERIRRISNRYESELDELIEELETQKTLGGTSQNNSNE